MAALTFEKFVELLKNFDRKHELVMGEVADMGDASLAHGSVVSNVFTGIHRALSKSTFRVLASNALVRVQLENDDTLIACTTTTAKKL